MKFISCTKEKVMLKCEGNEANRPRFAFDLSLIPYTPVPKKIVIKATSKSKKSWSMPWKKFLDQDCVGSIVIIPKESFESQWRIAMNKIPDLERRDVEKLIETLRQEVIQLRLWAVESRRGGWSTHQIEPMNRRAKEIENILKSFQS